MTAEADTIVLGLDPGSRVTGYGLVCERSGVLINPAEEKLQTEFAGVKRTFVPLHSVVRIDEVEHEGVSKVRPVEGSDNVTPFPQPAFPPGGGRGKD